MPSGRPATLATEATLPPPTPMAAGLSRRAASKPGHASLVTSAQPRSEDRNIPEENPFPCRLWVVSELFPIPIETFHASRNNANSRSTSYSGFIETSLYRPLSRRLDRCDRVIHNESGDLNCGNMCSFSGATCTSRVRHNADYVPYAKIRFDL